MTVRNDGSWSETTVAQEFEVQLGKRLDAAVNRGVLKPCINNRGVRWGRVSVTEAVLAPLTEQDVKDLRLVAGDVLVCEGGEIGRSSVWNDELPEAYFLNTLHRLRSKGTYEPQLLVAFLERWANTGSLLALVGKSSLAHLTKKNLLQVNLPKPPPAEQSRIVRAITAADQSVKALERLIAKKQAIKHGMMQELLTGTVHLPGYSGVMRERRLADVSLKIQDGTHFSPKPGGSDFKYVTSKNIGQGELKLDNVETISRSEHEKIYARCDTRFGDLLLTKDGANTGNVALNKFREEISLLSSVAFIRCDQTAASEGYLMYYMLSHRGRQQIADAMAGNAITRLTLQKIRNLVVPMPPADEQRAIARTLGQVDEEIAVIRKRLGKARAIKSGMMQQLLTGRTRLPVREATS